MTTYPLPLIHRPARWSLDVQAPSAEPVTLAELKASLYVEHSGDDTLIAAMGEAAREHVESWTKRALVTQTRVLRIDRFPIGAEQVIELPGGVIQSVTSIQYQDADNATQTLSSAVYATDFATHGGTGRVGLAYNQDWPTTLGHGLPVVITYVAGWASDGASPPDYAANVPVSIKTAIKMIVGGLYELRESQTEMRVRENPAVAALLSPWVVHRVS